MSEPKRHHYVPQFYQKGFTNTEGRFYVHDRSEQKVFLTTPHYVCVQRDLYAFDKGSSTCRKFESDILADTDGMAAEVFQCLKPSMKLTVGQIATLAYFIGFQSCRLPSFERMVTQFSEGVFNNNLRITYQNTERATKEMNRYTKATGEVLPYTPEEIVKAVEENQIKISATKVPFLDAMIENSVPAAKYLLFTRWTFLVAPQSSRFILCDDPFVIVPPEGHNYSSVAPGLPGVIVYFPLNESLCLLFQEGNFGYSFKKIDSQRVRTINNNIASHSERFTMGSNEVQLRAIVKNSCDRPPGEKYSVEVVLQDEDNALTIVKRNVGRYFY